MSDHASGDADFKKLMDHEYDGIREYDNPLPSWWVWIFVGSIVFSLGYWLFYHGGGSGLSETEQYAAQMEAHNKVLAAQAAAEPDVTEEMLAAVANDTEKMVAAKTIFMTNCLPCHGPTGAGTVGPNLTDMHQIHGESRLDIYKTIRKGVPEKGMIAWEKMLKPLEIVNLTGYVANLRGKNVEGGKAAEGNEVSAFEGGL